jgi:hypothetical protein
LIDDNSKELVQVNLRCTEEELLLQENSPSEDASLEENLEKEDELEETIYSFPGWDAVIV